MHRPILGFAAALAIVIVAPGGHAFGQVGTLGGDPFSLYYGYYLPHAAAVAAQPSPLDSINQMTARRQVAAQTDRSTLYDPISPYGTDETDPLSPYAARRGTGRPTRPQVFDGSAGHANARGHGPAMFYNRTAMYHPTQRIGRGPNRNIATIRGGRGGGGGGGMQGMPSAPSLPTGPR